MKPTSSVSAYSGMERTSLSVVRALPLLATDFFSVCLQRYGKDFSVTGLDKENQIATLASGKKIQYDALISTMPLDITLTWLDKKQWADGLTHRYHISCIHTCCDSRRSMWKTCYNMRRSMVQAPLLGCAATAAAYSLALTAFAALCWIAPQQNQQNRLRFQL